MRTDSRLERTVLRLFVQVRRVKQRLRWDAAHVEARAAKSSTAFDARNLEPKLSSFDGGDVATGTPSLVVCAVR